MKCVVADSGPLIALALLDSLHLPKALWGQKRGLKHGNTLELKL